MWDTHPVLYWRLKKRGKWTWQKARSAMTQMGLYAIEPPRYESEPESEGETE
jgi:hypothetical protein